MTNWLSLGAGDLRLDLAPEIGGSIARFRRGDQQLMRPAADAASDAGEMANFFAFRDSLYRFSNQCTRFALRE